MADRGLCCSASLCHAPLRPIPLGDLRLVCVARASSSRMVAEVPSVSSLCPIRLVRLLAHATPLSEVWLPRGAAGYRALATIMSQFHLIDSRYKFEVGAGHPHADDRGRLARRTVN
jgi:hypothetical protein